MRGITVCCGGIIGMGESRHRSAEPAPATCHTEPAPGIGADQCPAKRVEGTPLAHEQPLDPLDFVRMVATTRLLMPASYVRLSAGRVEMSDSTQALCFLAGGNSPIFAGDKLLTQKKSQNEDKDRITSSKNSA